MIGFVQVNTKDPAAVCNQAQLVYYAMYGADSRDFVAQAFEWFVDCFAGRYRDYQAVDMAYHDREHTMQGTLCYVRLMHGRFRAGVEPKVPRHLFELGLMGILLHDSGYLKRNSDNGGTGAKYTVVHVDRSCEFARVLLTDKGFSDSDIEKVQRMIRCTGVNVDLNAIPFESTLERIVGLAIATGDLLGQMSAADYVERLSDLYHEFNESWEYFGERAKSLHYDSLDQLLEKTPGFWEGYVKHKIEDDCLGLYKFLSQPYPDGPNEYLARIEANIDRVREINARQAS